MSIARCACGKVELAARGAPIVALSCYCTSCRTAGERFARAGAAPIVEAGGGTPCLFYRKDRVTVARGAAMLQGHRLKPGSPTRRVTASCCGTPLYADFTKGFWRTLYRVGIVDAPPVTMRVMTADRESDAPLPGDIPAYRGRPGKFMVRLLANWVAMGLRTPRFPPATP